MTNEPPAGKVSPATYPHPRSTEPSISPLIYKEALRTKHPKLLKVVIDSNVYISAILFKGQPNKVLLLARAREIKVYISPEILLEISEKLHKKFKLTEEDVAKILKGISKITEVLRSKIKLDVVKKDPSDNKILECAVVADADYIITGDKHLLKLKTFEDTKIVTPSGFLTLVRRK